MALTAAQKAEVRRKFPALAYLLDEPELSNLFAKAVQAGWGPGEFQAQLMATRWWKTHSETARNWDTLVKTDPAEGRRQRAMRITEVSNEVRRLGFKLSDWEIVGIAEGSLRGGWDNSRITGRIVDVARARGVGGLEAAGDVRASMQELRALAKQYAVNISNPTLFNWASAITTGRLTEDGIRANLVNIAKQRIDPTGQNDVLRDALDQGLTVRDTYQGVIQTVAQELEVDPSRVDLSDNYWGKLLDFTDDKGVQRPMNQTEAIGWARSQSAWQTTNGSREAYAGLANAMTTKWGLKT
jgi:hypothetical protein